MGNKNTTVYMVNNGIDLICTNIALGNESNSLKEENRALIRKITEVEKKIIDKIAKSNNRNKILVLCLAERRWGFKYGS